MANQINNRLIIVGLKENPEDFARELETQMYGRIVPHEPGNFFVEVVNGSFDYITNWEPKVNALIELSNKRKDHIFLLDYGGLETQRNGQVVVGNGVVLESIDRIGYSGLFDEIEYPTVDLSGAHVRRAHVGRVRRKPPPGRHRNCARTHNDNGRRPLHGFSKETFQ